MDNANKTTQVKVKKRYIVDGHSWGTIFWTTPYRARIFMDQGCVEIIGGKMPGPTVQPQIGPTEAKAASSDTPSNGRSTDSASFNPHGADELSYVSQGVQVFPLSSAPSSSEQDAPTDAAPSSSTTRTRSRRGRT